MRRIFKIVRNDLSSKSFWYSLQGSIAIALFIVAAWLAWMIVVPKLFPGSDLEPGTSGDMFGGLTALFSGLAFAGLISTLLMQSRELQLQREEMAQTRDVFTVQRFENTLFGLLRLLNDHVANIKHQSNVRVGMKFQEGPLTLGRSALKIHAQSLPPPVYKAEQRDEETGEVTLVSRSHPLSTLLSTYETLYRDRLEPDFAPYFRLLYNIFRLIDNTRFEEDEGLNAIAKKDYARIVRAHLSSSEVMFLMFNGLSSDGRDFKYWTEKFTLLKHLPERQKLAYSILLAGYELRAYQEPD